MESAAPARTSAGTAIRFGRTPERACAALAELPADEHDDRLQRDRRFSRERSGHRAGGGRLERQQSGGLQPEGGGGSTGHERHQSNFKFHRRPEPELGALGSGRGTDRALGLRCRPAVLHLQRRGHLSSWDAPLARRRRRSRGGDPSRIDRRQPGLAADQLSLTSPPFILSRGFLRQAQDPAPSPVSKDAHKNRLV